MQTNRLDLPVGQRMNTKRTIAICTEAITANHQVADWSGTRFKNGDRIICGHIVSYHCKKYNRKNLCQEKYNHSPDAFPPSSTLPDGDSYRVNVQQLVCVARSSNVGILCDRIHGSTSPLNRTASVQQ